MSQQNLQRLAIEVEVLLSFLPVMSVFTVHCFALSNHLLISVQLTVMVFLAEFVASPSSANFQGSLVSNLLPTEWSHGFQRVSRKLFHFRKAISPLKFDMAILSN